MNNQLFNKYFKQGSALQKLIILHGICFVIFGVLGKTIAWLLNINTSTLINYLSFPNSVTDFIKQPWSIITYSFIHLDFYHVLSNMFWLYFFGNIITNIHTGKRLLNIYFLGVIFGAITFSLAYTFLPVFQTISSGILIGASAGVSAVMVAATMQSPNNPLRFLFIPITFKLWWITAGILILDILKIPQGNAGGHIAHLGGAFIGYLYLTELRKGNDLGRPIEKIMDKLSNLFKNISTKKTVKSKKSPLRTSYRAPHFNNKKPSKNTPNTTHSIQRSHQKEIDRILDKIGKSGYESLSKEEKEQLFKAGDHLS